MRPTLAVTFGFAILCAACDPQGDCAHSYATPDATFTCRGGTFSVHCVGADLARASVAPYECTCTAPDGTSSTFHLAQDLYIYDGTTDFSAAYATVNASCHWHLSE